MQMLDKEDAAQECGVDVRRTFVERRQDRKIYFRGEDWAEVTFDNRSLLCLLF